MQEHLCCSRQTTEEGSIDGCSDVPSDSNIKKKEHEKLEKYHRLKEEAEKRGGSEGSTGDRSTPGRDPYTGRVASTGHRNNIRELCPDILTWR